MNRKAGFTLLETLAVLGITAMTLSLIYTVGMRGAFTGLRLGDRAIATADSEVAKLAYRDVMASFVVPPVAVSGQAAEDEQAALLDDTFAGAPQEVAGHFIALRDTPCGPAGTAGRMRLSLETDARGTLVSCRLDDAIEETPLVRFRFANAAFSFSEDGAAWLDEWRVERGLPVQTQILPNGELRQVFVRLAPADGASQVVALASSGRTLPQTPPQQAQGGGGGGGSGVGGGGVPAPPAGPNPGGGGRGGRG